MTYKVYLSNQAIQDLKTMEIEDSSLILGWLKTNLENTYNPHSFGKALNKLNLDQWIYYFGIYHLLSYIKNESIYILKITSYKQTQL